MSESVAMSSAHVTRRGSELLRLRCPDCGTSILVIRQRRRRPLHGGEYHADPSEVLCCDGMPMEVAGPQPCSGAREPRRRGVLIPGRRYRDALTGIKFLVTSPGPGVITCDNRPLLTPW